MHCLPGKLRGYAGFGGHWYLRDSLTAVIRAIGFPVTGGVRGTLPAFKEQINALAACHMRIGMWDGRHVTSVNAQPFQRLDVWFPANPDQRMLWPSTVTFSAAAVSVPSRLRAWWLVGERRIG